MHANQFWCMDLASIIMVSEILPSLFQLLLLFVNKIHSILIVIIIGSCAETADV